MDVGLRAQPCCHASSQTRSLSWLSKISQEVFFSQLEILLQGWSLLKDQAMSKVLPSLCYASCLVKYSLTVTCTLYRQGIAIPAWWLSGFFFPVTHLWNVTMVKDDSPMTWTLYGNKLRTRLQLHEQLQSLVQEIIQRLTIWYVKLNCFRLIVIRQSAIWSSRKTLSAIFHMFDFASDHFLNNCF